ncbi:uncharacterized protein V1510DRAFT_414376 [Dipodascopsis tothii]|uniref:uncharacterized protein n=1 Tax=Dipodascopsis tothii TaxID=44089 RepID=UPI0034CE4204
MSRPSGHDKAALSLEERFQRLRTSATDGGPAIKPAGTSASARKPVLGPREPTAVTSPTLPASLVPSTNGRASHRTADAAASSNYTTTADAGRPDGHYERSLPRSLSSTNVSGTIAAGLANGGLMALPSVPDTLPSRRTALRAAGGAVNGHGHGVNGSAVGPGSGSGSSSSSGPSSASRPRKPPANFPRSMTVSADRLADYIVDVPEQILLLDVRPRELFDQGHIYSKNIVCIDPFILRNRQRSDALEDALVMSPDAEQALFARRDQFELVVFYDQDTKRLEGHTPTGSTQQNALANLVDTIYTTESRRMLRRHPVLLVGGVEAWVEHCGLGSLAQTRTGTEPAPRASGPRVPSKAPTTLYAPSHIDQEKEWLRNLHRQPPSALGRDTGSDSSSYGSSYSSPSVYGSPLPDTGTGALMASSLPPAADRGGPRIVRSMNEYIRSVPDLGPSDLARRAKPPTYFYNESEIPAYRPPPLAAAVRTAPTTPLHSLDSTATLPPSPTVTRSERQHSIGNNYSGLGEVSAGTTGLKNMGNTCYMNSVLQCLAGTGPLARYFLNGSYRKDINVRNQLGSKGVLAKAFGDLLSALYNDQCTFIVPTTMREVTGRLRSEFASNDQQDAQEFLNFLLDGLHEDLNVNGGRAGLTPLTEQEERVREKFSVRYASLIEWERYLKSDSSVVVSLFQGQFQSRLRCLTCGYTSTTYNAFSSLSLPLPAGRTVSLKACLDLFVSEEILDKNDAWLCPACKQQRKASKTLRISRLPPLLLIHLKRFKVSGHWSNKLDTFVDFPTAHLDLTAYWPDYVPEDQSWRDKFPPSDQNPPFVYNLYGVVNHYGSVRGGHYTSYVKKLNKGWLIFDDSRVASCPQERLVSKDAYVLCYAREMS